MQDRMSLHVASLVALALIVVMFAVAAIVERNAAEHADAREDTNHSHRVV